jgi:archaellum component FlaF (FlaF/FlaG flagellin family)
MLKKILIAFLVIFTIVFTSVVISCEGAIFEASNLLIEPASALAGDIISVSVDVTNTGDSEDTYDAVLLVNGVEDSSKEISLAPGASQTVTFHLTREMTGVYEIKVGGASGEFAIVDLDEILAKAAQALTNIDSYHFTCTIGMELMMSDESLFPFEELP